MNSGLMPMRACFRSTGIVMAALDGAAAGLAQAQDDAGFERLGRLRDGRQRNGDLGDAVRVGGGRGVERLAHRLDGLVGLAELEAGVAVDVLGRRLDDDVAFDGEVGGRRAVEIAAGGLDGLRLLRRQRSRRRLELEVEALGDEVLDQERDLRDRILVGIGVQLGAPRAGLRRGGKRQRDVAAAEAAVLQRVAANARRRRGA